MQDPFKRRGNPSKNFSKEKYDSVAHQKFLEGLRFMSEKETKEEKGKITEEDKKLYDFFNG